MLIVLRFVYVNIRHKDMANNMNRQILPPPYFLSKEQREFLVISF